MRNLASLYRAPTHEGLLLLVLILVVAITGLTSSSFVSASNLGAILTDSATVTLLAIGVAVVIIGGGIDISIGATMAAAATVSGSLAQEGLDPATILLISVGVGLLLGSINAILILVFKIEPIVATLATLGIFRGVLTETSSSIGNFPEAFLDIAQGKLLGLAYPVWVTAVLAVVAMVSLKYTRYGRTIYAIGNNQEAVRRAGVNIRRYQATTYLLAGALAGLAGALYAARNGVIQPTAGVGIEFAVIAAVVVGGVDIFGGRGSVVGVVVAAVLLQVITSAMITFGVDPAWQGAVVGGTVVIAVSVFALSHRRGRVLGGARE